MKTAVASDDEEPRPVKWNVTTHGTSTANASIVQPGRVGTTTSTPITVIYTWDGYPR